MKYTEKRIILLMLDKKKKKRKANLIPRLGYIRNKYINLVYDTVFCIHIPY